jgi:MMPL family protein
VNLLLEKLAGVAAKRHWTFIVAWVIVLGGALGLSRAFGGEYGLQSTLPIPAYVPMLVFCIVFGLSMDYEVFLLSRVHEAWLATGDAHRSVAIGIGATARVITTTALIMIVVFTSFVINPDPTVKMLALGMAFAVLIDASLVRMIRTRDHVAARRPRLVAGAGAARPAARGGARRRAGRGPAASPVSASRCWSWRARTPTRPRSRAAAPSGCPGRRGRATLLPSNSRSAGCLRMRRGTSAGRGHPGQRRRTASRWPGRRRPAAPR